MFTLADEQRQVYMLAPLSYMQNSAYMLAVDFCEKLSTTQDEGDADPPRTAKGRAELSLMKCGIHDSSRITFFNGGRMNGRVAHELWIFRDLDEVE